MIRAASPLSSCFADVVGVRVPGDARPWLEALVGGGAACDPERFWLAFSEVPRRLGGGRVWLGEDERTRLEALGLGHALEGWRLDEMARVAGLLDAAETLGPDAFERLVGGVWCRGDSLVARAVLKALPMLPVPERFLGLALEGARSSLRLVLEALAGDNAYPATQFHEVHFNQLVVKAIAADIPLERIVGVRARLNPELLRLTRAHVALRRASGRSVPAALDRFAAGAGSAA